MSEFDAATPREEPHDGAHDAVRDALPALLHGRVTASHRADLERHLAHCETCDAELQLLASTRAVYTAAAPTIPVDRIAAAVRARTVPVAPARTTFVVRSGAIPERPTAELTGVPASGGSAASAPRKLPTWTRTRALRAFAATALLAVGSGTLLYHAPTTLPARAAVSAARSAAPTTASGVAHGDASGTLLGASFSDLSDSELAAVVAAVDDPASSTPAVDPAPVTPSVLTPDGE